MRVALLGFPRPLDGSSRRRGPAEDDVSLPEEADRAGRREAAAWSRASLTHPAPAGVAYALSRKSGEMTCCGRLANEQGGAEREGGNGGQRKEGVDQPCEEPGSGEEKLQEYCIQKASWVGCGQKSDGIVQDPAREFCSVL